MKYLLIFISLTIITSCSPAENPKDAGEAPVSVETVTEALPPATIETPTVAPDATPPTEVAGATVSTDAATLSYYEELSSKCSTLSESEQPGCMASVTAMKNGGFKLVDYNSEGETLPCSEGQKANTIRSPGSLTWCEAIID